MASLLLRIFLSRVAGTRTLGIYMMILPMIGLFISISQAGVPSALFTLSSDPKKNSKKLFISSAFLCFIQLGLCLCIILFFEKYFTVVRPYLNTIIPFICIVCVSALLRSYHLGKQQAHIPAISQVIEEIVRMSIIGLMYYKNQLISLDHVFLAMLCGESSSCLYMLLMVKTPKTLKAKENLKDMMMYKEILSISIPVSATQLIHSVCHSLEPMIYRYGLLKLNYSLDDINISYGILNGQVLSLLMIPTFLNSVIYRIILPKMTHSLNNKKRTQTLLVQSMTICLIIGLPFSIFFYLFPEMSLQLLYNTTSGSNDLKYLAIPFLVYYLQTPLQAYLQATMHQKRLLIHSLIQSVVSLLLLSILLPILGPSALMFSFLCGLLTNTILSFLFVSKNLFMHKE